MTDWLDLNKDEKFRRVKLYDMLWDSLELARFIVAMAPFGGPIATIRDPKVILQARYQDDDIARPKLRLWTSSGKLMSERPWTNGSIVAMGWSDDEHLGCVTDDGSVLVFDLQLEPVQNVSMGPECKASRVNRAVFWPGGVVCFTKKNELFALYDLTEPKPVHRLPQPRIATGISSVAVVDPRFTGGSVEVLIAPLEGGVIVVDDTAAQDQMLGQSFGEFVRMAVSPDGKSVACFSRAGALFFLSSDFQKNMCRFDTGITEQPLGMAWVGSAAVALHWKEMLLVVGPEGDFFKLPFDSDLAMVSELDGLRVVTSEECEFLERVPDCTNEIFSPGSEQPAAMLYFSYEEYESGGAKAGDVLSGIDRGDGLAAAIHKCLEAAGHEFEQGEQRKLLKAASYGALFCESWQADDFVEGCRRIRLLNAVRHPEVGMPLTQAQYAALEVDVLVNRLVQRHHHLLALRICEYMRMPPEPVLVHWAVTKIRLAGDRENEEKLAQQIIARLGSYDGISYSDIATAANQEGLPKLATMLLDCEPRAEKQVPLLIEMKEDELALDKAVESLDTDLVYMVLLHIRRDDENRLFELARPRPLAHSLLVSFARKNDFKLLRSYYYFLRQPVNAAQLAVQEAYQQEKWSDRINMLTIAGDFFAKDKESAFAAQAVRDQLALLQMQRKLEAEPNAPGRVLDKSVWETLHSLLMHNQARKAAALKSEFKVDDRRFWHIQVQAFARCRAWEELSKLAKSKKTPPIGWTPFVEACMANGNPSQAAEYAMNLSEAQEKLTWLCHFGLFKEAVEVAVQERDRDALITIRNRARQQPAIEQMIDNLLRGGTI